MPKKNKHILEKHFGLDPSETLLDSFPCALKKRILLQGILYVSPHNICFYSKIFKQVTKEVIPFCDLKEIRKANTAGVIPNAIELTTKNGEHFTFASFLKRDKAFELLESLKQRSAAEIPVHPMIQIEKVPEIQISETDKEQKNSKHNLAVDAIKPAGRHIRRLSSSSLASKLRKSSSLLNIKVSTASTEELQRRFEDLHLDGQTLQKDFVCSYEKAGKGKMYITDTLVCFYSNHSKHHHATKRILAFKDISDIRNSEEGIHIKMRDGEVLFFTFPLLKDEAHTALVKYWVGKKESSKLSPNSEEKKKNKEEDVVCHRELARNEMNAHFELESSESFVDYFKCEYQGEMAFSGTLYLTDQCIYFYSVYYGKKVKKVFPFHHISAIESTSVFGETAVMITCDEIHETFIVFKNRDECLEVLKQHWTSSTTPEITVTSSPSAPLTTSSDEESLIHSKEEQGGEENPASTETHANCNCTCTIL